MADQAPEQDALLVIERRDGSRDIFKLGEFEGHPFINIRNWFRGTDGGWYPSGKRGFTIAPRDLPEIIACLQRAQVQIASAPDEKRAAAEDGAPDWLKSHWQKQDRRGGGR